MKFSVLGCSGGIGGSQGRTTAFLVDEDILIDCGTGIGDLPYEMLCRINHVFLTHSHLDHIAGLPLLVDAVGERRQTPLAVHATAETIRILHAHVFNWLVWPDFSAIPDRIHPFMRFQPIMLGETTRLDGRRITAIPALHTVPAVGYLLDSGHGQLVFSGDTTYCVEQIAAINALPALRHLIIETAFANEHHGLALASRHLCPEMLLEILGELEVRPEVHISHLKPGAGERIMAQIGEGANGLQPRRLNIGDVLEF
ncbi:MAG: 3',5'-cyclic-nucleotide phosphodiesterase [Thauera sp.]|jgi:3',5'-cyclic-nucleotide phosphodiesterase|nr:3',5'-cyclic-nucleotide phosphodiesterase [Thauera sp.]